MTTSITHPETLNDILHDLAPGDLEEAIGEQRGSIDDLFAAWKGRDGTKAIIALDIFMTNHANWILNGQPASAQGEG